MTNQTISMEEMAEDWLQRLKSSDFSHTDQKQFEAWYKQNPEHSRVFTEAQQLDMQLAAIANRPAIKSLRQKVRQTTNLAEKSPLRRHSRVTSLEAISPRQRVIYFAVASLVLVAFAVMLLPSLTTTTYKTVIGEQRHITLIDGTRIILDTATHVRIDYNDQQRRVILTQGQAFFSVAPHPEKPFIVQIGSSQVTAVGTAFIVRKDATKLTVTLTEGQARILILPTHHNQLFMETLSPGEQFSYSPIKGVERTILGDINTAISWTTGKLVFQSMKLDNIIAEINRYTENTIFISDSTLYDIEIDGVFHTGDTKAFLLALKNIPGIQVIHRVDGDIEIRK